MIPYVSGSQPQPFVFTPRLQFILTALVLLPVSSQSGLWLREKPSWGYSIPMEEERKYKSTMQPSQYFCLGIMTVYIPLNGASHMTWSSIPGAGKYI